MTRLTSIITNLKPLSKVPPRPVVTWDKHERIVRNKEIWDNPASIVHRLPKHYQDRYWKYVLSSAAPVHYKVPEFRYMWDVKNKIQVEMEEYPVRPIECPEMQEGLWGGEGIVKAYFEAPPKVTKKILPRKWPAKLYYPDIFYRVLHSEVLNQYFKIMVTTRTLQLIDDAHGLDFYLLDTPEIDVNSRLGMRMKRAILVKLASGDYYPDDEERQDYIARKYARFVMPLEEAEWVGMDLNEACRKQQDIEDNAPAIPQKFVLRQQLLERLESGEDNTLEEREYAPSYQKSRFAEKYLGRYMKPIENIVRKR